MYIDLTRGELRAAARCASTRDASRHHAFASSGTTGQKIAWHILLSPTQHRAGSA